MSRKGELNMSVTYLSNNSMLDVTASLNKKAIENDSLLVLVQNILNDAEIIIVIIKAVATTALISLLFDLDNNAQWDSQNILDICINFCKFQE